MATLLLRLAGPMQSWGSSSKFDIRKTDSEPSKSGVIGMLAAALGRRRTDPVDDLAALKFGIREDLPGILTRDLQTVHAEKTYLTYRYYLNDAIFIAGLESDDRKFLEELAWALGHPVFHIFLGRKSCPPMEPLVLGIRDKGLEETLRDEPWQLPEYRRKSNDPRVSRKCRIVMDAKDGDLIMSRQSPLSFSSENRSYGLRFAKEVFCDVKD